MLCVCVCARVHVCLRVWCVCVVCVVCVCVPACVCVKLSNLKYLTGSLWVITSNGSDCIAHNLHNGTGHTHHIKKDCFTLFHVKTLTWVTNLSKKWVIFLGADLCMCLWTGLDGRWRYLMSVFYSFFQTAVFAQHEDHLPVYDWCPNKTLRHRLTNLVFLILKRSPAAWDALLSLVSSQRRTPVDVKAHI